jgi:hypothetical protein
MTSLTRDQARTHISDAGCRDMAGAALRGTFKLLTDVQHWRSLELLQSDVAPLLGAEISRRPFPTASTGRWP